MGEKFTSCNTTALLKAFSNPLPLLPPSRNLRATDLQRTLCFCLSGTNNMDKSVKDFTPLWSKSEDGTTKPQPVIAVAVNCTKEDFESYLSDTQSPPSAPLQDFLASDLEKDKDKRARVNKAFKITEQERDITTLEDAVLCRIGTKEFVK